MKPISIPQWPEEAARLLSIVSSIDPNSFAVGGSVRDLILKRPIYDLDLASLTASTLAKKLSVFFHVKQITLDEENAVYRLVLPPQYKTTRQIDIAQIQGKTIEEDLLRRDFTVNAMALSVPKRTFLDPRCGLKDIGKKILRCESGDILKSDPLRILRAFRQSAQLGFEIEKNTLKLLKTAKDLTLKPAGERIRSEILSLLEAPDSSRQLFMMDQCGVLTSLFPEMEPQRKTAVEYYGKGGVLTHSLTAASRADFLMSHLKLVFPKHHETINQYRRNIVLLASLLHDIAKPDTARMVKGRLHFFGHDQLGAKKVSEVLERLRFSREEISLVQSATRHHLRPGYLAEAPQISERSLYRFFRDAGENVLYTLLTAWADHTSYVPEKSILDFLPLTRKPVGKELEKVPKDLRKTLRHLQTVNLLVSRLLNPQKEVIPPPLLNGNEIMKALKISPGPEVGKILEKIREEQAAGKIKNREKALKFLLKKYQRQELERRKGI